MFLMPKWSASAKVAWSIWGATTLLIAAVWSLLDLGLLDPKRRTLAEAFRMDGLQNLLTGFVLVGIFMAPVGLVVYGVARISSRGAKSVVTPPK